jgi:ring-1,2-phenylacetyl-CoA epoxidase subunit PaaE
MSESKVTIIIDGTSTEVTLNKEGKTLLETAIDLGLDPPYSCQGGICTSCRAKVISGQAHMVVNHALTPKEVAQGYVLACQSHPISDELTLSWDE